MSGLHWFQIASIAASIGMGLFSAYNFGRAAGIRWTGKLYRGEL